MTQRRTRRDPWLSNDQTLDERFGRVRRRLSCIKIGCLFLLVLPAIVLWFGVFSHDWNLWRLERSFARLKHPPETRLVWSKRELGLLVANGNHIDYCVVQLRSYSGPADRVREFYKNKTVWNPIAGERWQPEVVFIDEIDKNYYAAGTEMPSPVSDAVIGLRENKDRRKNLYFVYVLDSGYDSTFDIRGW